jgi:hypothetical protein
VPHNIQLREELAQHVSQAVVAEVSDAEDDTSSEEGEDLEIPATADADGRAVSTGSDDAWLSHVTPSRAGLPGAARSPIVSVMSDDPPSSPGSHAGNDPLGDDLGKRLNLIQSSEV